MKSLLYKSAPSLSTNYNASVILDPSSMQESIQIIDAATDQLTDSLGNDSNGVLE